MVSCARAGPGAAANGRAPATRRKQRLDEIVVCAQFQTSHAFVYRIACRQEQDKESASRLAQTRKHLPSIQAGEHDVQNDQIKFNLTCQVKAFQSISGHVDDEACFAKPFLKELRGLDLIFNDLISSRTSASKSWSRLRIPTKRRSIAMPIKGRAGVSRSATSKPSSRNRADGTET